MVKVMSLLVKARSGIRFSLELGQKWKYGALKRLKLKNSGLMSLYGQQFNIVLAIMQGR